MYFCCLNHPVCGTLLWKPKLTNTAPSGDPFIYDPDSIPSSSGTLWNISIYALVPLPFSFLSHQHEVVSPLTTRKQKTQTTQSILTQNNNLVTNDPFKSLFSPSLTQLKSCQHSYWFHFFNLYLTLSSMTLRFLSLIVFQKCSYHHF